MSAAKQANRRASEAAGQRRRKRKRAGNRVLHHLLLLVFVLSAGAMLSLTVFFKIERLEVTGTDKYAPDDIATASGTLIGENLFLISKREIQDRLMERFPYIESVEVRRKFPPGVEIAVTQCVPAGALIEGEEVTLITRKGKVLERGDVFVPTGIPVIKGLRAGSARPGETLSEESRERLVMLDYLFEAVKEVEFGSITNVDLTDRLNMKIVYENRIVLELGTESELPYKLTFIKELLATKIGPEERGTMDAQNAGENKVIFRPEDASGNGTSLPPAEPGEEEAA